MSENSPALSYLMSRAQSGDQNAYRQVLETIQPLIYSYIDKRINEKDSVEDVMQNALYAIHKNRHTYRSEEPFLPWVYGITNYKVMDFLRRHYRITRNKAELGDADKQDQFFENLTQVPSNNKEVHAKEDLDKALSVLNDKQRRIVTRAKIDGLKIKEVANEMDMTESAVKVTIHRALKTMQEAMKG